MTEQTEETLRPAKKIEIGGRTLWSLPFWEYHRRGKNWVALIKGSDPKFKFQREFLDTIQIDGKKFLEEIKPKQVYEFRHIYYTGSGRPSPSKIDGFWLYEGNRNWKKLTEAEILAHFSQSEDSRLLGQAVALAVELKALFDQMEPSQIREVTQILQGLKKPEEVLR